MINYQSIKENAMTTLARVCCACEPPHLYGCIMEKKRECVSCEEVDFCWADYVSWHTVPQTHGYCTTAVKYLLENRRTNVDINM